MIWAEDLEYAMEQVSPRARLKKLTADFEKIEEFRRNQHPKQPRHAMEPMLPACRLQVNLRKASEAIGISELEIETYLEMALTSDEPLVQHQLKQLIAVTKLMADPKDAAVIRVNKTLSEHSTKLHEHQRAVKEAEDKYTSDYKNYNLQHLKMLQDYTWYSTEQFELMLHWAFNTKGAWQSCVLEALKEWDWDQNISVACVESYLELFEKSQAAEKSDFFHQVITEHRNFINLAYEELVDKIYNELLEHEDELYYYERRRMPDGSWVEEAYKVYEDEDDEPYHESLLETARYRAREELFLRQMRGEDGFDEIYR